MRALPCVPQGDRTAAPIQGAGVHFTAACVCNGRASAELHRSGTLAYDQLALVETLAIGAHAVERASITADDFVLVIGAGPIGLSVIQFVQRHHPTLAVMDVKASRLDFCRRNLGVTHTLAGGVDAAEQLRALETAICPDCDRPTGNAGQWKAPSNCCTGGRIVFVGLFQGELSFHDPNFHPPRTVALRQPKRAACQLREIIALSRRRPSIPRLDTHRFDLGIRSSAFRKSRPTLGLRPSSPFRLTSIEEAR